VESLQPIGRDDLAQLFLGHHTSTRVLYCPARVSAQKQFFLRRISTHFWASGFATIPMRWGMRILGKEGFRAGLESDSTGKEFRYYESAGKTPHALLLPCTAANAASNLLLTSTFRWDSALVTAWRAVAPFRGQIARSGRDPEPISVEPEPISVQSRPENESSNWWIRNSKP